jgi:hypothetical protein
VRQRWSDERIEDLARVVYHNDGRLDEVARMSDQTQYDLNDLKQRATVRSSSRLQQAAICAALASPFVTLILGVIYHH